MENKELTIKEIIEMVARDLAKLHVPINEMETIAIPVANAVKALNACIKAINEAEANMEPKFEEPEFEIAPVEEATPEE